MICIHLLFEFIFRFLVLPFSHLELGKATMSANKRSRHDGERVEVNAEGMSKLNEWEKKIEKWNEEANKEIQEVIKKYDELKKPAINELQEIADTIPQFWSTVVINHPEIAPNLNVADLQCLKFLKKVEFEDFEGENKGFKLMFTFDENPHLENEVLTKEFHMSSEEDQPPTFKNPTIVWKNELMKRIEESAKADAVNPKKVTLLQERERSFFSWLYLSIDAEYEFTVGDILKNTLFKEAVAFFKIGLEERNHGMNGDIMGGPQYHHRS